MLAVVAWSLAGDARPVSASHTKILLSRSDTSATAETTLLLPRNGTPQEFYIWVSNVHNATGASAFDVRLSADYDLVRVSFLEWYDQWISSTGRSPICLGAIGPNANAGLVAGEAYASCNTVQPPPPSGAVGTGKLVKIRLTPQSQLGATVLSLTDSFLVDTPNNPADQQKILPMALQSVSIIISKCADFDLNGTIDLFNDIFGVAARFGMSLGDPGWDSIYDLDDNGGIDLFNDIFNTAFQFGGSC
ncbi:MAG: hypothetical protein WEB04_01695 [Dehalococcoidia bacterium]